MSYGDFSSPQAQYMLEISDYLSNGVDGIEQKFYNLFIDIESAEWLEEINMGEKEETNVPDYNEEEYRNYIIDMIERMYKTRLKFYYRFIRGMEEERQ